MKINSLLLFPGARCAHWNPFRVVCLGVWLSAGGSLSASCPGVTLPQLTYWQFHQQWQVEVGGIVDVFVATNNGGPINLTWQHNGTNLTGGGRFTGVNDTHLIINPARAEDAGDYSVASTGPCGAANLQVITLQVLAPSPWKLLQAGGGPSGRYDSSMVTDTDAKRVLLYGGEYRYPGSVDTANDFWFWNGTNWNLIGNAEPPGARRMPGLAYDSRRKVAVLYGGQFWSSPPYVIYNYNDCWEWDGTTWTNKGAAPPGYCAYPAMDFDTHRGVTVCMGLFSSTPTGTTSFAVWEYDGSNWTQRTTSPPPSNAPDGRIVYDNHRQLCLYYGGFTPTGVTPTGVYGWDGTNWSMVDGCQTSVAPQGGAGGLMGYDPLRNALVLASPSSFSVPYNVQVTFELFTNRWLQVTQRAQVVASQGEPIPVYAFSDTITNAPVQSVAFLGGTPFWRVGGAIAYDPVNGGHILFGGFSYRRVDWNGSAFVTNYVVLPDTWLRRTPTPLIAQQPVGMSVCPKAAATLRVQPVNGVAPYTYQWRRGAVPLAGATNAALFLPSVTATNTGTYDVLITDNAATSTTSAGVVVALDSGAACLTLSVDFSGPNLVITWSDPTVVLQHAPAPNGPWTDLLGATSPFTVPPTNSGEYFRLKK